MKYTIEQHEECLKHTHETGISTAYYEDLLKEVKLAHAKLKVLQMAIPKWQIAWENSVLKRGKK